jgi:hypothetical protein
MPKSDYTHFLYPFATVRMIEHTTTLPDYSDEGTQCEYIVEVGMNVVHRTFSRSEAVELCEELKREAEVWAVRNKMKWKKPVK